MNLQPSTLSNDLIELVPLQEYHREALYKVVCDPLIWEQHPARNRHKKEVFNAFFADSIQSKGAFVVIEQATGRVIGSSRFKKISGTDNAVEIGWSFLARDKWGGRYNKAMKQLMIDYALQFVENVVFYIAKDNIRSQKAAEKIGASPVVEADLKYLTKEGNTDWTYRINKAVWRVQKA